MDHAATTARVTAALAGIEHQWRDARDARDGLPTVQLELAALEDALRRLRHRAGFESATLVTAVDHLPRSPRFELVHQLLSLEHRARVRLCTAVPEGAAVPSCAPLWPGAGYMERECFDMFGIVFAGHEGLKRLYMPDEYEHHPLRKDFPHEGIEPDRLYREWDRKRRLDWHPEGEETAR